MNMEQQEQQSQKPQHISYKEYRKKLKKNPNENIYLFITAFFVMLLLFLGIVKQLSPDIDVSISSNDDEIAEQEEKYTVDERLRDIQREDDFYVSADDSTFSPELEEKVRIPERERKIIGDEPKENTEAETKAENKQQNTETKAVTTPEQVQKSSFAPIETEHKQAPTPALTAKVVVGYYVTPAQAEVAKGILSESGLNIHPFVKKIGSAYTLQAGSFETKEKAQTLVNDLLKNNFPARIIYE